MDVQRVKGNVIRTKWSVLSVLSVLSITPTSVTSSRDHVHHLYTRIINYIVNQYVIETSVLVEDVLKPENFTMNTRKKTPITLYYNGLLL